MARNQAQRLQLSMPVVAGLENSGDRAVYVYDTEAAGLCVAVLPTGRKVFYWYGRTNGRPRRVQLGLFPSMTVTAARKAARSKSGKAAEGKDVAADRKAGRVTLGVLFDNFVADRTGKKRTLERDKVEFGAHLEHWRRKPVSEITTPDIRDLIARIAETSGKGPANKIRALLSAIYSLAISDGTWGVTTHPISRKVSRYAIAERTRKLTPIEAKRFLDAVDKLQRETTRDYLKICLFTGARRNNVASMEWSELDLENGCWLIPEQKHKGKKSQVIPLIAAAVEILTRRKESSRSKYVFPSPGKYGFLQEPKEAMRRVMELSGLDNVRLHDLRRTLLSTMANSGVPSTIIQAAAAHSDLRTTQRYVTAEAATIRQAFEISAAKMLGKAGE